MSRLRHVVTYGACWLPSVAGVIFVAYIAFFGEVTGAGKYGAVILAGPTIKGYILAGSVGVLGVAMSVVLVILLCRRRNRQAWRANPEGP